MFAISKEAIEKWLTPHQKQLVALAVDKLQTACHVPSAEEHALIIATYKEDLQILSLFNPFVDWDKLCKYCCDNGYSLK